MSIPYSRYVIGSLPWYGLLIMTGAALAVLLAFREEKRIGLPQDTVVDLALRVLPAGIFGARAYYVLFSWSSYRENLFSALFIWEGGLAIYGGLIAGFVCVAFFCRKRRLSLLSVCDALIPGVVLAQALGRWGNYFNQEAYGLPLTNPAFQFFPAGVQIAENGTFVWHMATFFYESVLDFGIFIFLMMNRRGILQRKGRVFFAYLFFYGAARLIVENFRMDSLYMSRIRISQLISVLLCAGILGMFYILERKKRKEDGSGAGVSGWTAVAAAVDAVILILLTVYCTAQKALPFDTPGRQLLFLFGSSLLLSVSLVRLLRRSKSTETGLQDAAKFDKINQVR